MLFRNLINLFYPPLCVVCGNPLVGDEHDICSQCLIQLPEAHNSEGNDNLIESRYWGRFPFHAATALLSFTKGNPTQKIVHQIKYHGNRSLAVTMGRLLGLRLSEDPRFADVDCLIPVPLHPKKEHRRGYNQSDLLCQGIIQTFPRPIVADNLQRLRNTKTQTHMNREQRLDNMSDVFILKDIKQLCKRHVLLIDDVVTTGATTEACCTALLKAEGIRISIAALAISNDT